MAVTAVVSEWNGRRYTEGNLGTLAEYMTRARIQENMNNEEYTLETFALNTTDGVSVGYRGDSYLFTVEITESGNSATVIYGGSATIAAQTDGSWNAEKGVNSPELFSGMTAVYWDESGVEHELTATSSEEEWDNWYDYNGDGDGQNK